MTEYVPAKTGEYPTDIPQFGKDLTSREMCPKDYEYNSLHLKKKYALIFALGRYLAVPKSENCELWGTVNIEGQISENII